MWEETMLVHPETGELLCGDVGDLYAKHETLVGKPLVQMFQGAPKAVEPRKPFIKDGVVVRPGHDPYYFRNRHTLCGCYYRLNDNAPGGVEWLAWSQDFQETPVVVDLPQRSPEHVTFRLLLPDSEIEYGGGRESILRHISEWNAAHEVPDEIIGSMLWKKHPEGGIVYDKEATQARDARLIHERDGKASGRHHVEISAWLTDEQMQDLHATLFVYEDLDPVLTLPVPNNVMAYVMVDGKKVDLGIPPDEDDEDEAEINRAVEHMRSVLGDAPAPGERRKAVDPEDVALLAAPEVEAISEPTTIAELVTRRDAIRKEMAEHQERQGDEWYNALVDELHYFNGRIRALEDAGQAASGSDGKEVR